MTASKKFTGELATPINPDNYTPGILAVAQYGHEEAHRRAEEELRNAYISKLHLLCEHYQIPEGKGKFQKLALVLAHEFVPGLRLAAKRGRKNKWGFVQIGALVIDMERNIRPEAGRGEKWAAQKLAKGLPWSAFLNKKESDSSDPNPTEALRRQYQTYKNSFEARFAKRAFADRPPADEDAALLQAYRDAVNKFLGS